MTNLHDQARLEANLKRFIAFRLLYSARFYYPVFTVLFLDYGLTLEQFAILNIVWALTIVGAEVPSGALADIVGRKRLVVFAAVLMVAEMALIAFAPIAGFSEGGHAEPRIGGMADPLPNASCGSGTNRGGEKIPSLVGRRRRKLEFSRRPGDDPKHSLGTFKGAP